MRVRGRQVGPFALSPWRDFERNVVALMTGPRSLVQITGLIKRDKISRTELRGSRQVDVARAQGRYYDVDERLSAVTRAPLTLTAHT